MNEITTLREMRRVPPPAELEAMRRAARDRFVAGTGPKRPRRRLPVLAGGLTAAAAASTAAALVLTGGPEAAPGPRATTGHTRTVVTAAWTVREDAGGTVTVYLRQYANPAGLQRTLRADGINAIVRPIPYRLQTITPFTPLGRPGWRTGKARSWNGFGQKSMRVAIPACIYAATDNAPLAMQRAVVTIVKQSIPAFFIIHPSAMPQGSALFLTFMANVPSAKTRTTSNWPMKPVVLDNDAVPACVPVRPKVIKSLPAPKAKPGPAAPPKAG
jgi:hypothetical protein